MLLKLTVLLYCSYLDEVNIHTLPRAIKAWIKFYVTAIKAHVTNRSGRNRKMRARYGLLQGVVT